ncbi:cytochrome c [bacterium]|nr:cytochrome c [bacterium]
MALLKRVGRAAGCGLFALTLAAPVEAGAQDVARGAQLFDTCVPCHGANGAGSLDRRAPVIAALPAWYVATQIGNFKAGRRGYHPDDAAGLQMRPMAMALFTDADVQAVAAYVATLPPVPPTDVGGGDAGRGQTAYAVCLACHGPDGMGNEQLKAPPIARQGDWYLVAQLDNFKSGRRGSAEGDVTGMQMRGMSATLADQQAVQDVAAYVRTLRK